MASDDNESTPTPNTSTNSTPANEAAWVPDAALEALKLEAEFHPTETPTELTTRLFEENAPQAAMSIVHAALHSMNERVRFDASKYVVERLLGRVGDSNPIGADNPLDKFFANVEKMANSE